MIENKEDYENFYKEVVGHDLILHIVPSEPDFHAAVCHPIAALFHDIQTNKGYCMSFDHPDIDFKVATTELNHRFLKQKNRLWALDKKSLIQTLPMAGIHDINLLRFLKNNSTFEFKTETAAHAFIKRNYPEKGRLGRIIPLVKHKEIFDEMVRNCIETVKTAEIDDSYNKVNTVIIETLAELEHNGIHINKPCFDKHFGVRTYLDNDHKHMVYSQYNPYTSTGRPSNCFDGVNYAALKKDDGCRECFVSRHLPDARWVDGKLQIDKRHGKMLLIDYSAFHPRIISHLTGFNFPLTIDIYQYLGELYFNKQKLNPMDIEEAKKLTFRQLYGGVEKRYEHIKYFDQLKDFVEENWRFFCNHGYVDTPIFKRKITEHHIKDPNPNKLFNYILQATETEIAIPVIRELNTFLRKRKTKAILYTYDSVLFDFCRFDAKDTLSGIVDIMRKDNRFPIKLYVGDSYATLNQIAIS